MESKVAIVTGAGGGVGRAVALRLAREGASVVAADVDVEGAEETVRLVGERGGWSCGPRPGRRDRGGRSAGYGRLRGAPVWWVGRAGQQCGRGAGAAHWGRTIDVNLDGMMLGIQAALPAMRRRGGGVIVNVSSMAGVGSGAYDMPEYAANKAAVVRLTSALGFSKEEAGVRVNCVCPGWVGTQAVRRALTEMTRKERQEQSMPPPDVPIPPGQIGGVVVRFVRDQALAGRVVLWPDDEAPRLMPEDA